VQQHNFVGDVIAPTPDYGKVVEAYGGASERVQHLEALAPALQRGLETVASGRTFLLDVLVKP
jgi:acetolactate synthase-1/2/3 large subunit